MNKSFAALLTILIAATNALSQSFTLDSFTKAKAVLDRSATAYGGREALNAIANVSIRLGGESVHRNQSRKPGDLDRTEYTGQISELVAVKGEVLSSYLQRINRLVRFWRHKTVFNELSVHLLLVESVTIVGDNDVCFGK